MVDSSDSAIHVTWNRPLPRVAIQTHGTEHLPVPFVN